MNAISEKSATRNAFFEFLNLSQKKLILPFTKTLFRLARIFIAIQLGLCCLKSGNTKDTYIFIQWLSLAPSYKRYHSSKGKFQTSTQLLNEVGLDQDDKSRHDYLKKDVAPHLLIRPKF